MVNKKNILTGLALSALVYAPAALAEAPAATNAGIVTLTGEAPEGMAADAVAEGEAPAAADGGVAEEAARVRKLEKHEQDDYMPELICRTESPRTGSRVKRKKCYTPAELERARELRHAAMESNSSRFKRAPKTVRAKPRGN